MAVNTTDVIKRFEGFHSQAYWDVSQWSVGYGSYAGSRDRSQPPPINNISEAEAARLYEQQIQTYVNNVDKYDSTYNWTDNERAALTSFAYNNGGIDQLTANGTRSREEIADKMMLYSKARTGPGGSLESVDGLVSRRAAERHVFLGNDVPEGDLYEWGRENRPPGYGGVGAGNDLQGAGGQGSNQILEDGDVDLGNNADANTGDLSSLEVPYKSLMTAKEENLLAQQAAEGGEQGKQAEAELFESYKASLKQYMKDNPGKNPYDTDIADQMFNNEQSDNPGDKAKAIAFYKAADELLNEGSVANPDREAGTQFEVDDGTVTDTRNVYRSDATKRSPEPNWYTSVDLPTYNWTFYLTNREVFDDPETYLQGDRPDPSKAIIIAKSGVEATYTIDNFLFNAVLFGDDSKGSAQTSTMQFELKEPMGFTLLDAILSQSANFNFKTMKDATYVLKLEFVGRDFQTGRQVKYDGMHFFPVVPYGITSDTGPDGTSYMFTCLTVPSLSAIENTSSAGEVHIQAVSTLGEYASKLETGLNEAEILAINPIPGVPPTSSNDENYLNEAFGSGSLAREDAISNPTTLPRRTWKIQFDDETSLQYVEGVGSLDRAERGNTTFDLSRMPVAFANSSGVAVNTDDNSKIDARLTKQSNVVSTIKMFIKNQPAWNQYVRESQETGLTTPTIEITQSVVGTEGRKDEPDDTTQQKPITTIITIGIKHRYGVVKSDGSDQADLGNKRFQQERFEKLPIVKKYDYLFTGQNTEVLNYSAQFNMLFSIATDPRLAFNTRNNQRDANPTNYAPPAFLSDIPVNTDHANVAVNLPRDFEVSSDVNQRKNQTNITVDQMEGVYAENYANRTADTQVIEVDVIGDPYLLGVPGATFTGDQSNTLANVNATSDIFVAFLSYFPKNENTLHNAFDKGKMDLYTSGVYELREVEHRFQQGQYVSKLRMYRDHKSSTYYLQEELKNL